MRNSAVSNFPVEIRPAGILLVSQSGIEAFTTCQSDNVGKVQHRYAASLYVIPYDSRR